MLEDRYIGLMWIPCVSKPEGCLNFQDLEAFNLALLANQVWKLIASLDSLLNQVSRAKY